MEQLTAQVAEKDTVILTLTNDMAGMVGFSSFQQCVSVSRYVYVYVDRYMSI